MLISNSQTCISRF